MTKEEFLMNKEVVDFIDFLKIRINNSEVFTHTYLLNKPKNTRWHCHSIFNAFENYQWHFKCQFPNTEISVKGKNYIESEKVLLELQRGLKHAMDTNNDIEFKNYCIAVLQWGGVLSHNKNRILSTPNIIRYFKLNVEKLINPSLDTTHDFSSIHMNAGYTKIYSLLIDDFVIYDGRVGAAIGLLVRLFLYEEKKESIPETLDFAYGNPKLSYSNKTELKKRNPSDFKFKFKSLSNNSKRHINNNLRANWLLEKVAMDSKFNLVEHPLRSLESALFMIGYDVR
jgi:hypothetical protein